MSTPSTLVTPDSIAPKGTLMTTATTATTDIPRPSAAAPPAPIPFARLAKVELRKMFDTRSGLWLMISIAAVAVIASVAVIAFAPDSAITFQSFAAAIGFPMAIVLPIIAIMAVTSEYSQRSGLTTFTLVPHRGRVIGAKAAVSLLVAIVSMVIAGVVGALGNLLGASIAGVDTVWNVSVGQFTGIVLANVLGMAVGFAYAILIRNTPGAVVAYFVYALALPTVTGLLAGLQDWFNTARPWVDFNYTVTGLFDQLPDSGQGWAQLATSGAIWLLLPAAIGLRSVLRSEVK